jgi:hypothetical protein
VFDYKAADWDALNLYIEDKHLVEQMEGMGKDIDAMCKVLTDTCGAARNCFIPMRKLTRSRWAPWISAETRQQIRLRDVHFRKWTKVKNLTDAEKLVHHSMYLKLKNSVRKMVTSNKLNYVQHKFKFVRHDGSFWVAFNQITGKSHRKQIPSLTNGTTVVTEAGAKAKLFAESFSNVWTTDKRTIEFVGDEPCPEDEHVSAGKVYKHLRTLNVNKQGGPDNLSARLLRRCASSVAQPLTLLINVSLKVGRLPQAWKIGRVVPVEKSAKISSADPSNYRPICLLNVMSKIMEKCVMENLRPYIEPNLSTSQFGFRPGLGTQHALLSAEAILMGALETCRSRSNKCPTKVAMVCLDVAKAFDTTSHYQLLANLRDEYHIPSYLLRWLSDYLTTRQIFVSIEGERSELCHVRSGVPQGSILGPLLYISLMNRLADLSLSPNCRLLQYADDLCIIKPLINAKSDCELNADGQMISRAVRALGQTLNATKTQAVLISMSPKIPPPPILHIDGQCVHFTSSVKYLGVQFDNRLNWTAHTASTTSKARRKLGALCAKLQKYRIPKTIGFVWTTCIEPIMLYSCFLTYGHNVVADVRTESVQRMAARAYLNNYSLSHEELKSLTNWSSIGEKARMQRLRMMYNFAHNLSRLPATCLVIEPHVQKRTTRSTCDSHSIKLTTPFQPTLRRSINSCLTVMSEDWNHLPPHVTDLSRVLFKRYTCL